MPALFPTIFFLSHLVLSPQSLFSFSLFFLTHHDFPFSSPPQRYTQEAPPHSWPGLNAAARLARDAYSFPVQVLIQDAASGLVLTSANANQLLDIDLETTMVLQGFLDPTEFSYFNFLQLAVEKYGG